MIMLIPRLKSHYKYICRKSKEKSKFSLFAGKTGEAAKGGERGEQSNFRRPKILLKQ